VQEQDVVAQEEEQMLQDLFPSFQTSSNVITMTKDAPLIGGVPQGDMEIIKSILRSVRAMILLWPPPLPICTSAIFTRTTTR